MNIQTLKSIAKIKALQKGHEMNRFEWIMEGYYEANCKRCGATLTVEASDISQPGGKMYGTALSEICVMA